jgi:ABC-type glycerol-3-phosphate transport system substrate-binding protein
LQNASASADVSAAFAELAAWKKRGWFASGLWNEGWAKGLAPLANGTAAFALVNESNLSPLPPETLRRLEFLRFPRGQSDVSWTIGSAAWLAASVNTKHPEETLALLRFLSSPGVTSELTALTGRPFFAWNPETGKAPTILASWAEAALTPEYESFARTFDPGN